MTPEPHPTTPSVASSILTWLGTLAALIVVTAVIPALAEWVTGNL